MDPKDLFELAGSHSGETFDISKAQDPERYLVTEIWGYWNGHDLRFVFSDSQTNPPAYRYNVAVFEADTNEQIATGNGGPTWAEAFDIVHWQDLENFEWAHSA